MGLIDLDVQQGVNDFTNRLLDPFRTGVTPADVKSAHERNDFREGMQIVEFVNGKELTREQVLLIGDAMPVVPFVFGGVQKIVKDFYPGNSEPTIQVLGPRENNLKINGRLKAKRIKIKNDIAKRESFRTWPQEMQQLMEAMRIRGNLIRLTLGEYQRFVFLEEAIFRMRTLADIEYELDFTLIGVNPPSDCKILTAARTVPTDINKEMINEVAEFQALQGQVPTGFKKSLADQINNAISDVAISINQVTNFIDTLFNEVDDIKSAANRALGLMKHAKTTMSAFIIRVGGFDNFAGGSNAAGSRTNTAYNNWDFINIAISEIGTLNSIMDRLFKQIAEIAKTEPLARHRVAESDTLQRLAHKFYGDSEKWELIFDHNKLTSTLLVRGTILEIPKDD